MRVTMGVVHFFVKSLARSAPLREMGRRPQVFWASVRPLRNGVEV